MTRLDLRVHKWHEYEGKGLTIDGCPYVVGPRVGGGELVVVHELVNEATSVGVNVIKFYPGSSALADNELAVSQKLMETARAAPAFALNLDGVSCLVQQRQRPLLVGRSAISEDRMSYIVALLERHEFEVATADLLAILRQHPKHSLVLLQLALAYCKMGEADAAVSLWIDVGNLEPHWAMGLTRVVEMAADDGVWRYARKALGKLHRRFIACPDADEIAHRTYMVTEPAQALALATFRTGGGPEASRIRRERAAEAAARLRQLHLARAALARAQAEVSDAIALEHLQRAYELYPCPYVTANLGLVLSRLGRAPEALQHLSGASAWLENEMMHRTCVANALRVAVEVGSEVESMASLLSTSFMHNDQEPPPGVALWICPDGTVIEEADASAMHSILRVAIARSIGQTKRILAEALARYETN